MKMILKIVALPVLMILTVLNWLINGAARVYVIVLALFYQILAVCGLMALVNGSVTRDGFEIEKITESYSVSVQKDSNSAVTARTGSKYTSDGKYTFFTSPNKAGTESLSALITNLPPFAYVG